jgi:DnaA family protein
MKQLTLAIAPPPAPGFDNYVAGANAAAAQHLAQLVLPGTPLYLWGPTGSGKTHLLQALAARVQADGGQLGWFDAADPLPWVLQPSWSLLVVDRCEALDADAQHAAFTLFVEAGSHGVQWAAAGQAPPVDLPLRDDLRSRLGWGHVFALAPLDEQQTRAALRREADRRGIWLSDEVMGYLLSHFARDLKHLMALLDRLDHFALAEHRAITVPLLKKMLAEQPPQPQAA